MDSNTYIFMDHESFRQENDNDHILNINIIARKIDVFLKCGAGAFIFDNKIEEGVADSIKPIILSVAIDKSFQDRSLSNLYCGLSNYNIKNNQVRSLIIKEEFDYFKENIEANYDDDFGVIQFLKNHPTFLNENYFKEDGYNQNQSLGQKWKEIIDYGSELRLKFGPIENAEVDFKKKIRDIFPESDPRYSHIYNSFINYIDKRFDFRQKQPNNHLDSHLSQRIQSILEKRKQSENQKSFN